MLRKFLKTTMKVLTVVLSFCGGFPSTSINNQIKTMKRVQKAMNVCTNGVVDVVPIVWSQYVNICPNNCDANVIASQVASKIDIKNERYVMYILPDEPQCDFAGLGIVGPCLKDRQCNSWINGQYVNLTNVYLHELGHNLGLGHAKYSGNFYGDLSDIMGECCKDRCFNAVHLDTLRVGNPKVSLNYPINKPIKVKLDKNEYVKIVGERLYYIQNRQSEGYDQLPGQFGNGINVYIQHLQQASTSELLLMIRNTSKTLNITRGISMTVLQVSRSVYTIYLN
jgi:hypothetical protein